ncbi:hypothetical protein [Absidia glauca]|uniref:UBC core domain-containing protein n=1 Tax=Absidia glauca TaxID=4829 RepID=A0A168KKU8_ABSGL|nr:hypothetical protein [Absidia glauca]
MNTTTITSSSLLDDSDDNDEHGTTMEQINPPPCYRRYELLTEFMNLQNGSHCPLGIYLMPCAGTLNVWYGVLFLHQGLYSSGVFKFRIVIPDKYPSAAPSVTFLTDVFHPLIDSQGNLTLTPGFPVWRAHQDYLIHLLRYIKNIFKRSLLSSLSDPVCLDKEAYRLYRQDGNVFRKMAQQCAQLSITEFYLFDHFPNNNLIRFTPMNELVFGKLYSNHSHTTSDSLSLLQ